MKKDIVDLKILKICDLAQKFENKILSINDLENILFNKNNEFYGDTAYDLLLNDGKNKEIIDIKIPDKFNLLYKDCAKMLFNNKINSDLHSYNITEDKIENYINENFIIKNMQYIKERDVFEEIDKNNLSDTSISIFIDKNTYKIFTYSEVKKLSINLIRKDQYSKFIIENDQKIKNITLMKYISNLIIMLREFE